MDSIRKYINPLRWLVVILLITAGLVAYDNVNRGAGVLGLQSVRFRDVRIDNALAVGGATTLTGGLGGASLILEGATDDTNETTLSATDPTADNSVVLPNASGTVVLSSLATNAAGVANSVTAGTNQLIFEGATGGDGFQMLVTPADITGADKTLTLANASGTVMLSTLATNAPEVANSVTAGTNQLIFEGATGADGFQLLVTPADTSGADKTLTLPSVTGAMMVSTLATNAPEVANSVTGGTNQLIFEGATGADGFQMLVTPTDITGADKTLTLPNATGTVMISTLATNAPEVANSVSAGTNQLIFEGATGGDGFQMFITPTDITGADKTLTLPNATGTVGISTLATNAPEVANSLWFASNALVYEGSVVDAFETNIVATNPTAIRTITWPDASGTVLLNPVGLSWAFTGASFATTITAADPAAARTVTLPDASGTVMLSTLATNAPDVANSVTGGTNQLVFEGATGNTIQTFLTVVDPTLADKTITLPNATGVVGISTLTTNAPEIANSVWFASNGLVYEGSSEDEFETTLSATNPTADRAITLPDVSGSIHVDEATQALVAAAGTFNGNVTLKAGTKLIPENATNYGAVFSAVNSVAYTNSTNKTMFVLPANADIVDIMLVVTTIFNDSGNDNLSCGYTVGAPNEYINAAVVSAAGVSRMGVDATMPYAKLGDVGAGNVTVLCKYTGQNGDSSAGAATVQILYRID